MRKKRIISGLIVAGLLCLPIGPLAGTASAAIALNEIKKNSNGDSGGLSLTIDRPLNVAAGNLLVAQITYDTVGSNTITPPPSTGAGNTPWNQVRADNFSTDLRQVIYTKVASPTDVAATNYTWTFTQSGTRASGGIARYTGVNLLHPSGPVVAHNGGNADTLSLAAPEVTAPANSLLVGFFGIKKRVSLTTPLGMTEAYFQQHPNSSGPSIKSSVELWTTGGATGSRTSTAGEKEKAVFQLIALRPNTVPAYTPPSAQAGSEGTSQNFNLGSFTDPDAHGTWSITVNWGDGSPTENFSFASDQTGQTTQPPAARNLGTRPHTYNDNGSYIVTVTINDGTDSTNGTFTVPVANLPPTATFGNNGPVSEGGAVTVTFTGPADPSPIDTAAGFRYAFDCGGVVANLPTTYTGTGTQTDAFSSCTFNDNGSFAIAGRIFDKDNGHSTYSTTATVTNVAPTATLGNDGPIDEGGSANVAFTNQFDPSTADTTAGFHYSFACDGLVASLFGTYADAAGQGASTSCTFTDQGVFTVHGRIFDKDNGQNTYPTSVVVNNVAPTATLTNNGPIAEGGSATVTFSGQFDPSAEDTTAGFRYAFNCAGETASLPTTYAAESTQTIPFASCTFNDNGSYSVVGRIFDKDDGFTDETTVVEVSNVAPTATLGNDGPVSEGLSATVSFTEKFDPSSVDAASLRYAFRCDGNAALLPAIYDEAGSADSVSCSYADNGSYTVVGRIFDKDNAFTDYSTIVSVSNANPLVTSFGDQGPVTAGTSNDFDLGSFSDLGVNDGPWAVTVNWGDSSTPSAFNATTQGALGVLGHTFASAGLYTVTVRVTDKDGGFGEGTFSVLVDPAVVPQPAEITFQSACTAMTNAPKGDASKYLKVCTPDEVQAGDLLLAHIAFEKGSDAGTDVQLTPPGWTLVRRTNSKTDIGEAVYYRVATGSEPLSHTWTFRQAVKAAGGILRYSGVDTTNPILASSGNAGDSSKLTALSVNADAKSMLVALFVFKKKDTTLVVPATMTQRYNFQNPQDVTIRAAEELRETTGATGDRVATPSPVNSDKWAAQLVVLRAAP